MTCRRIQRRRRIKVCSLVTVREPVTSARRSKDQPRYLLFVFKRDLRYGEPKIDCTREEYGRRGSRNHFEKLQRKSEREKQRIVADSDDWLAD